MTNCLVQVNENFNIWIFLAEEIINVRQIFFPIPYLGID